MKAKLIAISYTMFFTFTVLASPVFMEWYMVDILGRENSIENTPITVDFLCFILFCGQVVLTVYLWVKAFDTNKK